MKILEVTKEAVEKRPMGMKKEVGSPEEEAVQVDEEVVEVEDEAVEE